MSRILTARNVTGMIMSLLWGNSLHACGKWVDHLWAFPHHHLAINTQKTQTKTLIPSKPAFRNNPKYSIKKMYLGWNENNLDIHQVVWFACGGFYRQSSIVAQKTFSGAKWLTHIQISTSRKKTPPNIKEYGREHPWKMKVFDDDLMKRSWCNIWKHT